MPSVWYRSCLDQAYIFVQHPRTHQVEAPKNKIPPWRRQRGHRQHGEDDATSTCLLKRTKSEIRIKVRLHKATSTLIDI